MSNKKVVKETKTDSFEDRKAQFIASLERMQESLGINIYAANVVLDGGEVHCVIKLQDTVVEKVADDNKN